LSFYFDASAILPALVADGGSAAIDTFMTRHADPILVSDLAAAEVASGISRLRRTGAIASADAADCLGDFDAWRAASTDNIDVVAADARLAAVFVRRFELALRAPGALHAAICRRTGCSLVTLDRRLARAATALGVTVVVPVA